ncbi:hypothetical protein D3C80_1664280 [compost metagenome]
MANAATAQQAIERGVEKSTVARFGQHDVARLRDKFIHQLIIPAAFCQQRALQFWAVAHGFQCV